jgi:hypothetical protein
MAILNYTSKVKATRTIEEIAKILISNGATKIITDYKEGKPVAVSFCVPVSGNLIPFSLPANYEGVLKALKNDPKVSRLLCTNEHATNVSWRIIKDWIEAQMALVKVGLADMAEVFLPYAVHKSGETLYNHLKSNNMLALNS